MTSIDDDVLENSTVFQDLVTRTLETDKLRSMAAVQARTALRYLHKVIESERKDRTEDYWLEAYLDEFDLAIELELVEKGPEAERNGRVVHYISSTSFGRDVYRDLEERGYTFDTFQKDFRRYLESCKKL